ncbi:MAG: transposase [Lentisphaeraceae bacterium]|nr:transposase [Lentisphaeraceae bacterium]
MAMERRISCILDELNVDYYSQFTELENYDLIAGDGHYIEHACHTPKAAGKDKVYAPGHIFIQNLRNGMLKHYSLVSNGSVKKHEIPIFRDAFNQSAPTKKRSKRLWILDRAYIDQSWWAEAARKDEYIITRAKENFNIMVCGEQFFDKNDPVNTGVQRDYFGGLGTSSTAMRFIDYIDPETQEKFRFLTTNEDLSPGLIAWLYFKRWTIEKTFDTTKNAFFEKKAWATSENTHELQALFVAMAYNFMRLINDINCSEFNEEESNLYDKKYRERIENRKKKAKKKGHSIHPFLQRIKRMPQLGLQFIRGVKNRFSSRRSLRWHIPSIKSYLTKYL